MADKQATVYILDLGSSMARTRQGRAESDLDWSMHFVWDKIATTVAASRKTWNIGVLGVRTDATRNPLGKDDGYEHISVLRELGPMGLTDLRVLGEMVKPSRTDVGDSISAIVIATNMIEAFTKKLKYHRKIVLVTDGEASVDPDDFDEISAKIKDSEIQLVVLSVSRDSIPPFMTLTFAGELTLMIMSMDSRRRISRCQR